MKFFRRIIASFTTRRRALSRVDQGMACANNGEPDFAIKHYTDVIHASESPRDVKAMALLNRALVYTTIGKELQATADLKAILKVPEAITRIKKAARDKLVRMQRKLKREETARNDGQVNIS